MQENITSVFIGTDSIRYCSSCKEPLEKMIDGGPILGMDRFPRMCACQSEKQEIEQKVNISRYGFRQYTVETHQYAQ